MDDQTLVVGATGILGLEVVRLLREAGTSVRAVVRGTAAAAGRSALEAHGVQSIQADLKDPRSLDAACRGIVAVVSTASATLTRQQGDSIQSVDESGQMALVEAAEKAGVRRFVFISLPPSDIDYALMRAKRRVEARLRNGPMSFTILRPGHFMEVWLSSALGFDVMGGKVRIFGDGTRPVSWVSLHDVARFAAKAAENERFAGKVLELGGPDALPALEIVRLFEALGAPPCAVEYVSESALELQLRDATNSLEEAYAALMLTVARGQLVDRAQALELLPGGLLAVGEYARRIANASK